MRHKAPELLRSDGPGRWASRAGVSHQGLGRQRRGHCGGARPHLRAGIGQHRPGLTAMMLSPTRKGYSRGQRAEARQPGSQEAKAGQAESDRGSSPGLGATQSGGQEVTGHPEEGALYYFASLRNRHLSAFTTDQHGSNLPAEHGPWAFERTIVREGFWHHPAPRALVEAGLEREGVYLWVR